MKRTFLLLVLCVLGVTFTSHAQFLKKLSKRAEQAAERAVIRKSEEKASRETEKAFDEVFNSNTLGKKSSVDSKSLPDNYAFSWKYSIQMNHKQGDLKMHYFLNNDSPVFASKTEMQQPGMGNMYMVFDTSIDAIIMLMESDGQKIGQIMDMDTLNETASETNDMSNYKITELGTKTILGYNCQGIQIENDDYTIISYIATDAPVSFKGFAQANTKVLPKGLDKSFFEKFKNGLMMEMDFKHKRKKRQNGKMTCVGLEKVKTTLSPKSYTFMGM